MPEEPQPQSSGSGQPPRGQRRTRVSAGEPNNDHLEGVIRDASPNATFNVELKSGQVVIASIGSKIRKNFIKLLPGDSVRLVRTNELWRIVSKARATR